MRFEQRPIVGRITLLSALVKAYKPRHRLEPDPVSGSFDVQGLFTDPEHSAAIQIRRRLEM
jgi:hypothetical protein